jgi:hypothetical protein
MATVFQWFCIKTTRMIFSGLTSKLVATVFAGLTSKPVVTISASLTSKPAAMVSDSLTSKPAMIVSSGLVSKPAAMVSSSLASKPAVTVSRFGSYNRWLRFDDLCLKITGLLVCGSKPSGLQFVGCVTKPTEGGRRGTHVEILRLALRESMSG